MSGDGVFPLEEIWNPAPIDDYKIHFARWNGLHQPLDVFVSGFDNWKSWQEYRASRDDFNRPYIFSLIQDYRAIDEWLFGGIWRVTARHADRYEVELSDELRGLIGRLRIRSPYKGRATRCLLESYFEGFQVAAIEREPYAGRSFPGLSALSVSLAEFREIVRRHRLDWHGPLANLKGIYLLRDRTDGKLYVGSAYGEDGIWSRWSAYAFSGQGGNVQTVDRFGDDPVRYGTDNIEITLLEPMLPSTGNEEVFARENFWKVALGSRENGNLNSN